MEALPSAGFLLLQVLSMTAFISPTEAAPKLKAIEVDFWEELAQIQTESIGWILLDEGAYLHVGSDAPVIQVVGVVKEEMAGSNVLWLL